MWLLLNTTEIGGLFWEEVLGKLCILSLALGISMIPLKRILAQPTGFGGGEGGLAGG